MTIKENDFIEIQFTGRIKNTGEVFDTNVESVAKESNLDTKNIKPFIMSVGHKMLPNGFDKDLIGKETEGNYSIELKPEDAFGKRNSQMVRMIPTKMFHEQQINPVRGMQLALDGQLVKILSSDRGRTLVDFNNPLAGKDVIYEYKILREVTDNKGKINALQEFLFRKQFEFDIIDNKVIFKIEKEIEPMVKMFAPKFKEILEMEIESEIIERKSEKNKSDN